MKRREFIFDSSIAIGSVFLLTGCNQKGSDSEIFISSDKQEEYNDKLKENIDCISCNNCTYDCPKKINIPKIFSIYNDYQTDKDNFAFYQKYAEIKEEAQDCVKCELCVRNCPKNLQIPKLLEQIAIEYNNLAS